MILEKHEIDFLLREIQSASIKGFEVDLTMENKQQIQKASISSEKKEKT